MALRKIVQEPDEALRKKCRVVTVFDERLATLIDDLHETMTEADGVGLAAPQVSVLKRVAVAECEDFYLEMVNPVITASGGEVVGVEGCLSVDGYNCNVLRPEWIELTALDRFGKPFEKRIEGYNARICCHEIDHLDGILFIDKKYSEVDE